MSAEQNKALIRRLFEEGLHQNKSGVIDELLAPNFVIYGGPPGTQPGPEGFRKAATMFRTAFPDVHVTFEAEFADGAYVFHRGYITGTHQGAWQGIAPTGKQAKIQKLAIWPVAKGKPDRRWVLQSRLGL